MSTNRDTEPSRVGPLRSIRRALLIGAGLTIAAAYWSFYVEMIAQGGQWTGSSLMRGPLSVLFCVVMLNLLGRRLRWRHPLEQRELLIIYTMVVMGAAIQGTGMLGMLTPMLASMQYYARSFGFEPFLKYAPQHLIIHDPQVIDGFFRGGHSIWSGAILKDWAGPILRWSSFMLAFIVAMLCIQSLVRRQWLNNERLVFPLAFVPLALTERGGQGLKGNRLFWAGFTIIAVAQILSGLSFYYPAIPKITLKQIELEFLGRTFPWSQMAGFHISWDPFIVSVAYFVNLDVSLSVWVFYGLFKITEYIFALHAWPVPALWGGVPGSISSVTNGEGIGAFIGLTVLTLWMARRHLVAAFQSALRGSQAEPGELVSYRTAFLGALLSGGFMLWFVVTMGVSLGLALPVLAIMFAYTIALSRLIAEAGYAYHTPEFAGGLTMLTSLGTRNVPIGEQTAIGYLTAIDRFYQDNPSAQQMNTMKLGEQSSMAPRHILIALLVGAVVALIAGWWAQLAVYYKYGAGSARMNFNSFTVIGSWYFKSMKAFFDAQTKPDQVQIEGMVMGFVVVAVLMQMRSAFMWFPLHPAGYMLLGTPAARFIWMPFMIGWAIKMAVVHYGGLAFYRRCSPFFLGVIVGDVVAPAAFAAYGAITGQPTYQFF